MKEILGEKLSTFFDTMESDCDKTKNTYHGDRYEVWEVSDDLYERMCRMTEEEFSELANDDVWWRSSEGSNLGIPDTKFKVNGKYLLGWDSPIYSSKEGCKYSNLSEYLCRCIGCSQPRNVCACAVDLAKYNNMTMAELFKKYER